MVVMIVFLTEMCLISSVQRVKVVEEPSRVDDCDSDVIASSTPQLVDSVAVHVCRELSTSPPVSIADSSSSSRLLC